MKHDIDYQTLKKRYWAKAHILYGLEDAQVLASAVKHLLLVIEQLEKELNEYICLSDIYLAQLEVKQND
jgi:hypothetical protein